MSLILQSISYEDAQAAVAVIIHEAQADKGEDIAVAVVGRNGQLMAFGAMSWVKPISISLAQNKAYTALALQRDTVEYHKRATPPDPANFGDPRICFLAGGILIKDRDHILGAIGVSGRNAFRLEGDESSQKSDDELAREGLVPIGTD